MLGTTICEAPHYESHHNMHGTTICIDKGAVSQTHSQNSNHSAEQPRITQQWSVRGQVGVWLPWQSKYPGRAFGDA